MEELKPRGLVLVGEAPSRTSNPARPLSAEATRRKLAWLFGAAAVDRAWKFNLLGSWPGKASKGARFDVSEARITADSLTKSLHGVDVDWTVVVLGLRAALAFVHPEAGAAIRYFAPWAVGNVRYVVIPHPSGIVRWWNEKSNRLRAVRFCRKLARETDKW